MKQLINILKKENLSIASIESLTGGLFASELVKVAGASEVFLGSIVSYANSVKKDLLNIDQTTIDKYGVVSEEIAVLMANNGSQLLKSDVTLAFTGNAGPATLENKGLGLVFTCIKIKDKNYTYTDKLLGSRNQIRKEVINLAKTRLIELLKEKGE
ncbi:MAG: CinA family protein [Erysipelothrix sp.]|nr:CinA family protein [Erysipelothrix sp.]